MAKIPFLRRDLLKGTAALAATAFASPLRAQTPPQSAITPALIEAARKDGRLSFYTSMDLLVAEHVAKAFEAKFSGIAVRVERTGSERIFQRIAQEYGSRIYQVDVVSSADASHPLAWKRDGWLAAYLPEDVVRHFPKDYYDPDGQFITTRVWLCPIGYNTNLVKAEDAPKSFADLLDPKWAGKMVKAHPGSRALGEIKVFKDDPAGVEKMAEEIKARYARLFGV